MRTNRSGWCKRIVYHSIDLLANSKTQMGARQIFKEAEERIVADSYLILYNKIR